MNYEAPLLQREWIALRFPSGSGETTLLYRSVYFMKITKDMIIKDILDIDRGLGVILRNHGMNCVGCPSGHAQRDTLENATSGHGVNIDELIEEMNAYLANAV